MKEAKSKGTAKGYRLIFGYLGLFMMFIGIVTIIPIAVAAFYPNEAVCWMDFVVPGAGFVVLGALLFFLLIYGREKERFGKYEDALLLLLIWIAAVIAGALPFISVSLRGELSTPLSFSEALFESVSGYSATGYTVYPLADFVGEEGAYCPHVFMFHRAFMQFVGGIGLVLIVASVLSDRYNLKLYFAEGHNDKLLPNLAKSAKLILAIYTGYIVAGAFGLWFFGMDFFDAVCHSIGAVATGGFSSRADGVYWFQTSEFTGNGIFPGNVIGIEVVLEILMILGATNFVLHTFIFRGKIKEFFKDIEIRLGFFAIVFFVFVSTITTCYLYAPEATNAMVNGTAPQTGVDLASSLRYSAFNIISSITTTGFTNFVSIKQLGEVAIFSGIIVMIIGAGAGSTGGAIKQYRVGIIAKDFFHSVRYRFSSSRQLSPKTIYRLGVKREIEREDSQEAHNFAVLYIVTVLIGTLALLFLPGIDFQEGLYEVASGLSGTGQSIIDFFAYKANHPLYDYEILLWVINVAMLLGRLEIIPLFSSINRIFVVPFENRKRTAPSDLA